MIFEGQVVSSQVLTNFPFGREVQVHTDANITIAFWFPKKEAYGNEIAVNAPGSFIGVGGGKGRITGNANVRIV